MYNYNLLNDEEVILISDNTILKKDNKDVNISTILTNKRLILLDYPSGENNYEEALRTSRGVDYVRQKEEFYSVMLEQINNIEEESSYDKYILVDSNYFLLNDKDIREAILNNDK